LVDRAGLTRGRQEYLREKLRLIADWAKNSYDVEAHFFVMDPVDIVANRLGELDAESSGNVMPRLLKEELYRTLLHVAGRFPLWWAAPADFDPEEYSYLSTHPDELASTTFNPHDFVDLGFPEPPPPREYLGSAMWQIFKSRTDPFKALLKMVLLLEQVESGLQSPLLCDVVKRAVLSAKVDEMPVDPYMIALKRVLDYVEDKPDFGELVRVAAFFKMFSPFAGGGGGSDGKTDLLRKMSRDWNWDETRLRDHLEYARWPERRKLALGEEVKDLVSDLYSRIASRLRANYPEAVSIQGEDMARLNARVLARFGAHANKIRELPSSSHGRGLPLHLTVLYDRERWVVHETGGDPEDYIYTAPRAAKIAAWLVHNGLWRPELKLRLQAGPKLMKMSALLGLLSLLGETLPPLSPGIPEHGDCDDDPAGPLVAAVNLEEPHTERRLVSAESIYRTRVGETYHVLVSLPSGGAEAEKILALAGAVVRVDGEAIVYVPPGDAREDLILNLNAGLRRVGRSRAAAAGQASGRSRTKLDLD
jgi:adenylate cyclase class 1